MIEQGYITKVNARLMQMAKAIKQEAKQELFDELDKVRISVDGEVKLETFFDYKDIKKKHLSK